MFWVYILQSAADGEYYIGQTQQLEKRIVMHNTGQVRSTKSRTPFTLVKSEVFATRGEARKRENYLKKLKGGNEFKKVVQEKSS